MRKIRDVLTNRFERIFSNRRIAAITGLHHSTIADYLKRFAKVGLLWPLPADLDDTALENLLFSKPSSQDRELGVMVPIDFAEIHAEMQKRGATIAALHSEWQEKTPPQDHIVYAHFCKRYKAYTRSLRLSMRRTEVYGENAYVDYSGQTIDITDPHTGEIRAAQIFIGVLGGSSYTYCEATWTQRSRDWLGSHVRMFEYFGGISRIVVPDNLKAAVTKADRFSPVLNESYRAMCRHYGVVPLPARAYRPKDKARAEGAVLLAQRWILFRLRKRKFFSLDEANREIRTLLEQLNRKSFQKLAGSRYTRWLEHELPTLLPLPSAPYEYAEWGKARAGIDYHVKIDNHHYSVPYQMRGNEFEYRMTDKAVELIFKGNSLATHRRSYEAEGKSTLDAHRPPAHQAVQGWNEEDACSWAATVGRSTEALLRIKVAQVHGMNMGYRITQSMKSLSKAHGPERLEEACAYALANSISGMPELRAILDKRLDKLLSQDSPDVSSPNLKHENIRGAHYYDRILNTETES